eukprot:jgi/Chlat1/6318/Chrsp44S09058
MASSMVQAVVAMPMAGVKATPAARQQLASSASSITGRKLAAPILSQHKVARSLTTRAETQRQATQERFSRERPTQEGMAEGKVPGLADTVWEQRKLCGEPIYPKLQENMTTDVVVIGGGIAGVSTAYNLAKKGKKVVLLEARTIGAGQTGRTTAHLMGWNDDYYHVIEEKFDNETARRVAMAHRKTVDFIEQASQEEGIECEFLRCPGYLYQHSDDSDAQKRIDNEFKTLKTIGWEDAEIVDVHEECGINAHKAIKFPTSGQFQPLKYIRGLAEAAAKHGVKVYEMSSVAEIDGGKVSTIDGYNVTADDVVMATNSPINHNLLIHARQHASKSYVIGLKLPKEAYKPACWWDTDVPYHYVRLEPFDDYDVLVVGGSDHQVGLGSKDYPPSWDLLREYAEKYFPKSKGAEELYRWSGQLYEPIDMLHLIGREPNDVSGKHWIATGDSGEGMTMGTVAGMLLSDLITGKANEWESVYSPTRFPSAPSPSTAVSPIEVTTAGFVNVVRPRESFEMETINPGSGMVVQKGADKVALYRNEQGAYQQYSAICPHLKCLVEWNPAAGTFDCPCHGSQFDRNGQCIQGPAKMGLTPYEDKDE